MSAPALDLAVFKAINGLALAPLDELFRVASSLEFGLGTAALIALYFARRRRWDAVWFILAFVAAIALCDAVGARVLKPLFGRVRPCYALPPESVRLLIPIANSGSMPSLHTANNFAGALVAFLFERRTGYVLFPVAALVALSRVGLGVHWPTDLLAGILWGALAAAAGWGVARLLESGWRRRRGPAPAPDAGPTL